MKTSGRVVVVSNRLPIQIESTERGPQLRASSGGLVTALMPVLKENGGWWVGWTGTSYDETVPELVQQWGVRHGVSLMPVFLTAPERDCYYRTLSNETIWPLFHGVPSRCRFDSAAWDGYQAVNDRFAEAVERVVEPDDFIWVHDYHLMLCGGALRALGMRHRVAYFHHIPFPAPDVFEILPWRSDVLRALTEFDAVGFQTHRDRRNFIAALHRFLPNVRLHHSGHTSVVRTGDRSTTVGTYPISIDYKSFTSAGRPHIAREAAAIRGRLGHTQVMLGVDRLDYSKGIPERLAAFELLLEQTPELHGRVTLLQIVVPSREEIPEYQQLRHRIELLVSRINGAYARPGWTPINYFYRAVSNDDLMAFYGAANVAVVTPLKDGMNLVAKEFCAARSGEGGVLVLSEFAGAAEELRCGALLVNPHDTKGFAAVLRRALEMDQPEQKARMRVMQTQIRTHDVFNWWQSVLSGVPYPNSDFSEVGSLCIIEASTRD